MDARIDTRETPEDPRFKPNFNVPVKVFDFCEMRNEEYVRFLKARFENNRISFCLNPKQSKELDLRLSSIWLNGYHEKRRMSLNEIAEKFGVDPIKLLHNYELVGSTFCELFKGIDIEMFIYFNVAYSREQFERFKKVNIDKLLEKEEKGELSNKESGILSGIRKGAEFYKVQGV